MAAALWGTTGTAQVFGGADDPVAVGAARLAVGGAALVAIALVTLGPISLAACLRWPLVGWAALAAVATAVYQTAFFSAVASTGVATGTVIALGTAPVATGVCGAVLFGERLTRWWSAATGLAGAVLLTPVLLAGGAQLIGLRPIVMVGWLGLVTTTAAYLLFARGLRQLPAGTVGTLSLAEPLTAATLGLLVLGERPAPLAALGALTLLAGLILAALRPQLAPPYGLEHHRP